MKANDNWNPAKVKVPISKPTQNHFNQSSMQLIGTFPSSLGSVYVAGFSPDGRYYWTGGTDRTVRVYDTETGKFAGKFITGNYPTFTARILSDNVSLCSFDHDTRFRNFNLETKNLNYEYLFENDFIDATEISPDGRMIFICFSKKPAVCCRVQQEGITLAWTACLPEGNTVNLDKAVFSTDGTLIAGMLENDILGIWYAQDGTFYKKLNQNNKLFRPVQFSTDNSKLLCWSWDKNKEKNNIVLLHIDEESTLFQYQSDYYIQTAAISPNGQWIASGDREGQLTLWNVNSGTKICDFLEHGEKIFCLAFSPDNRLLLSGGDDGLARLWNIGTGKEIRSHEGHIGHIFWQALSRDCRYLAYHDNTEVRVVDVQSQTYCAKIKAKAADDLCFDDDSQAIHFNDFSKEDVHNTEYWNIDGEFLYNKSKNHDTAEWLENSRRSYSIDKKYYLKRERTPKKHFLGIPVSASSTTIDVYRSEDDHIVQQFKLPYVCDRGCQRFALDGKRIILAEPRGYHIGNVETGNWELFLDYEAGKGINEVDISPDGIFLSVGLYDGTVRLWDLDKHCWVRAFEGHPNPINALNASNGVSFSKDGTRLMTTDIDYTFVWNVVTGKCLGSIFKNGNDAMKTDNREEEQFDEGFSDNLDIFLIKKGCSNQILYLYTVQD
ncbi:MAG: hypothetical protein LBU34_02335 [Planctomycetaceae bacterium]|jgi:WD40 repeat protein|nr:hypothetical protein [Planctomycetaceae bacterium]